MKGIATTILLTFILVVTLLAQPAPDRMPRFQAVDLYVDSGKASLAAYQLEFSVKSSNATVVGIEGGEHAAFKEAPYYDPKAIQKERVIIGAFNTSNDLPRGKTRVATIHLRIDDYSALRMEVKNGTAATAKGTRIVVEVSFAERNSK